MSAILHGPIPSTYTQTVFLALKQKGVDFELRPTMPHSEEQNKRHPWGYVPAFEHNGSNEFETSAIIYYIDEVFDGPPLIPTGELINRMKYQKWITVVSDYMYDNIVKDVIRNRLGVDGEFDEQRLNNALDKLEHNVGVIALVLGTNDNKGLAMDVHCGSDFLVWPIVNYLLELPEQEIVRKHENVVAWHQEIAETDGCRNLLAELTSFRETMQNANKN